MEHFQITRTVFGAIASTEAANHSCYIRLLKQEDEDELCRIFLTLEPSARCCRFGQVASDAYLVNHAKRSLTDADWIIDAFVGERIRGLVEVYSGRPSSYAEAAFVVEQEWRRRGLGWALLQAAIQKAGASGADTLRMVFSRHNWPMRKLASKASSKLDMVLDEMCVDAALRGSTKIDSY
jgi:GNAT superfamily N-acetyltransferase